MGLAMLFMVIGAVAFYYRKQLLIKRAFAVLVALVLLWWLCIRPQPDGPWLAEVSVMPQATIDGDRVRLIGFRNFDYRSTDDFTVRFENREVFLSHLTAVDLFISYWKPGLTAHTFLSFRFDNAPPVCISIEARRSVGQIYSTLPSLFKQYQLIYVVGDERDIVRVRTNYRKEDVYLYHIHAPPEQVRALFRVYLDRINKLADRPEFYHLLKNNCTVNLVRGAQAVGKKSEFDYRHILNGLFDQFLYEKGLVNTSIPFAELRERSHINASAQAADRAADFSDRIRVGLPN